MLFNGPLKSPTLSAFEAEALAPTEPPFPPPPLSSPDRTSHNEEWSRGTALSTEPSSPIGVELPDVDVFNRSKAFRWESASMAFSIAK